MSNFLYFCPNCNKLYKAGASGKKLKCSQCSELAIDLGISDDEYREMNKTQKQELKERIAERLAGNDENEQAYDNTGEQDKRQEESVTAAGNGTSQAADNEIPGNKIPGNEMPGKETSENEIPKRKPKREYMVSGDPFWGRKLKLFSLIGLVLSLVGGVVIGLIFREEYDDLTGLAYGLGFTLLCVFVNLAVMGAGEICILLAGVNERLEDQ